MIFPNVSVPSDDGPLQSMANSVWVFLRIRGPDMQGISSTA